MDFITSILPGLIGLSGGFLAWRMACQRAKHWESETWFWKRNADDWRQHCHQLETQLRDLAKEPK